jgi:U3 small nucleolar RNA-associated protein 20
MGRTTEARSRLVSKSVGLQKHNQSTKKHKFEPFSQRIARLKIDPIRRTGYSNLANSDSEATGSYFRASLDSWKDLNLSEHFTKFRREIEPFCDSLPQILHHEDQIANILIKYLQIGAGVSLEPLLDLVAHFAHDLGPRFEKHFSQTVEIVSRIASSNPDVNVIEWSFNCLAWLFKYLSKLLVPDLRPLFDLLKPLLGQQRQKDFVTRFAAEAFSFLIRRASVSYHKNQQPLRMIVAHVLESATACEKGFAINSYLAAITTLFSESINGVNGEIVANGDVVFEELLSCLVLLQDKDFTSTENAFSIVRDVLASTVARISNSAFTPILNTILRNANQISDSPKSQRVSLYVELLLLPVCCEDGKVVDDWRTIFDFIETAIDNISSNQDLLPAAPKVLGLLAASHCTAPMNAAITYTKLFRTISDGVWCPYFLGFCELYAELDHARFMTFVQPYFKRYVISAAERYQYLVD